MAPPLKSSTHGEALARATRAQADAADPVASVWVNANAGTGKTEVLTRRVLRLMLSGTKPERILCLTYTKSAASEMSKRVFDRLAGWVTLPDDKLSAELTKLLPARPSDKDLARARTLFTTAIETPGGFKVQTIHAFAERLLQRFPLEAGIPPGFSILDDVEAKSLRSSAIDDVLTRAAKANAGKLGAALDAAVAYAHGDRFDEVLTAALANRDWLDEAVRIVPDDAKSPTGFALVERLMRVHLNVGRQTSAAGLVEDLLSVLSKTELKRLAEMCRTGSTRDQGRAADLNTAATSANPADRLDALESVFLDVKGKPRSNFATKGLATEYPEVESILAGAQSKFVPLWTERKALIVVEATMALHHLADAVQQRYSEAKRPRAALDFEDLIACTRRLLLMGGSAQWVLFKLDNGLDHVLVDESQDTSPGQWDIVASLAREFFDGAGASETARTLFAVGDEKQSIYSFQGAAPEMFAGMGRAFADSAKVTGRAWRTIDLDVSFRTIPEVLDAVDRVFADHDRTPGVTGPGQQICHIANRIGQAGGVEIWPVESAVKADTGDIWSPVGEPQSQRPELKLAARIGDTIKGWLDSKEWLASADRPVEPGDILILLRKRRPFAVPMVAALKARGIPVAGADRLRLTDQIAVQDLMSLGEFLTLPENDLALAEVLKSPIFDLDDDDLFAIAHGRKGTLWRALLDASKVNPKFVEAAERLKGWRKAADFTPPYEFWATLLDAQELRSRMLARLGPDAADPLDEFLNLALHFDDTSPPSLTGFLHALRQEQREIKRDMDLGRNEVRVMTVHGAKGLEGKIVILPDTCTSGSAGRQGGRPIAVPDMKRPKHTAAPFIWPVKGTSDVAGVRAARDAIDRKETEERQRLLYVAMTRARDRLIVAGFESGKGRERGCWYDMVVEAVAPDGKAPAHGQPPVRLATEQSAPPDSVKSDTAAAVPAAPLPNWAKRPGPREKQLTIPLAPSRLAPYDIDETGDPQPRSTPDDTLAEPSPRSPARGEAGGELRFLRGTLTHALLQHLPNFERKHRAKAAERFVAARGSALPARVRKSIVGEALAVLDHDAFAPVFATGSRAEVPIIAEIVNPDGRGVPLKLTGQIDRLAVTDAGVMIVDFKTNRSSAAVLEDVAVVYLYQLAAYRLALQKIYPGQPIRAALLWTDGPKLMEVPPDVLDRYAQRLWQLDTSIPILP